VLSVLAGDTDVALPVETVTLPVQFDAEPSRLRTQLDTIVADLKAKDPQVLLFVGLDPVEKILRRIKDEPSLSDLPVLLSDGVRSNQLTTIYDDSSELPWLPNGQRGVFGVNPAFRNGTAWANFDAAFRDAYRKPPPVWSEQAYDAVYLLAYAAASASPEDLKGRSFAAAFERFDDDDGKTIPVGSQSLVAASTAMRDGEGIQVEGASGPLDFDSKGDPSTVGILRWTVDIEKREIRECGLVDLHQAGTRQRYWCNALCKAPNPQDDPCDDQRCDDSGDICSEGFCTGGDDCRPDLAL